MIAAVVVSLQGDVIAAALRGDHNRTLVACCLRLQTAEELSYDRIGRERTCNPKNHVSLRPIVRHT
jgi:hypothetical protein